VTHGQCNARPTVTFSVNDRYQFILLGEQRHTVYEQLAQSCYVKRSGPGLEPATSRLQVRRSNHYAITPLWHKNILQLVACFLVEML